MTEASDIFVSYASADRPVARALADRLAAEAGITVWIDRDALRPGHDWHAEVEVHCEAARIVVPLISEAWPKSEWTRYETYGHDRVFPVAVDADSLRFLPAPLRRFNATNLPDLADASAWDRFIARIRTVLAESAPDKPPRLAHLPYGPNPYFAGREDDLVRVFEALHESPVATLIQGRVRALAAMGGVGKTTLANEYARRFWRLYRQILWIDARGGLEAGFAALFPLLFPGRPQEGTTQADRAAAVLVELRQPETLAAPHERLLVIDNAEDAESVRSWLAREADSRCRTLITSRYAEFPMGIPTIALDALQPEPARDFLLKRTGIDAEGTELAACEALAADLGYLPLALEQAGAYIASAAGKDGFAAYRDLYRAAREDLLGARSLGSTDYPDSVLTTWRVTIDLLSPESRAMLRMCAWYAATPIPRSLVLDGAEAVDALAASFGGVGGAANPQVRMREALFGLARYSMVLDATDETFRVHGLVQAVEQVQAANDGTAEPSRGRALARLAAVFPYGFNDPAVWPLCRLLMPHQTTLLAGTFPDTAVDVIGTS